MNTSQMLAVNAALHKNCVHSCHFMDRSSCHEAELLAGGQDFTMQIKNKFITGRLPRTFFDAANS